MTLYRVEVERVARERSVVEVLALTPDDAKRIVEIDAKQRQLANYGPWHTESVLSASACDAETV
jgi:hypothetical protein